MAAGSFTFFNTGIARIVDTDFDGTAVAWVLLTSAYTPDLTDSTFADISTAECVDGDYSQQSVAITASETSGTVTLSASGDEIDFGSAVTITAKYLVAVQGTAGSLNASDKLIGYVDLNTSGGSVASSSSTFKATFSTGLATLAAA